MKVITRNIFCNYLLIIKFICVEKLKIENISQILDEITMKELQDLPEFIEKCSIRKLPEIGFLLCLPFWKPADEMTENYYEIQNLEFKVFDRVNIYYFKNVKLLNIKLNNF